MSGFEIGAEKGLRILFEGYGQKLFGFSVTQFHINEDEGYDVLYKTLETVGKVITRYEFSSESHFVNWLFKIHKNNVLQFLRSKKRKEHDVKMVELTDWENEVAEFEEESFSLDAFKPLIEEFASVNPYENSPETSKLFLAMQKALQEVTETERDLLLLRMNEYSYEEIAKMLNIENNQLKVKFLRAKAKVEKRTFEILKDTYHEK